MIFIDAAMDPYDAPPPRSSTAATTGPSWTAGPAGRNTAQTRSSSQPHKAVNWPSRPQYALEGINRH